jgi:hypothetical protein
MIIRHAEKPVGHDQGVNPDGSKNDESLIVAGWQRSGGLVVLFAPARGPLQSPELATPGTVIASWTSADKGSQRPRATVETLAKTLQLDSRHWLTFDKTDIKGAVDAALAASGTALICWQHEDIPTIATTIASKSGLTVDPTPPTDWPGYRFDLVWVLSRGGSAPQASWAFAQVPQLLLPGDLSSVISA